MKHIVLFCVVFVGSVAQDWIISGEYEYKIFEEEWIDGKTFEDFQELCAVHGGEVAVLKDENVANLVMNSATSKFSQYKNLKFITNTYSISSLVQSPKLKQSTKKKAVCLTKIYKKNEV